MKVIADRMVFVGGTRIAAGQVFELPEGFRLSKYMTRVDDAEPTGELGTRTPKAAPAKRGRKPEPAAEPQTIGEIARLEAAALAMPEPGEQPST